MVSAPAAISLGSERAVTPVTPARYDVTIAHHRRDPIDYRFTQRSSTWLIDLDAVPQLPRGLGRLVRFDAADHLGDHRRSLRSNVDRFLVDNKVASPARVLMLANPRVLGYVFNPLSVYYCYDTSGALTHSLAEVCNTYGGRHTYLFTHRDGDAAGRASTDKLFYVSPFNPVQGRYDMRLPEPGSDLAVSVTLYCGTDRPFVATMTGTRSGSGPTGLARALRTPLATRAVMAGIRRHGITLFLKGFTKGLKVQPRPDADRRPSAGQQNGF